jgi:hypothetical protein
LTIEERIEELIEQFELRARDAANDFGRNHTAARGGEAIAYDFAAAQCRGILRDNRGEEELSRETDRT